MAEGTIRGKEVLDGVKEEISPTNAELKKLLATIWNGTVNVEQKRTRYHE